MTTVFFAVLNFVVLLVVAVYMVTKYVVPFLRIAMEEAARRRAHDQKNLKKLEAHEHEFAVTQATLEHEYEHLRGKVMRWHASFSHQQEQRVVRQREAQEHFETVREQQVRQRAIERERRVIVPQAFEQARSQLQQTYQDPAMQQALVATIMQSLARRMP